MLHLIRYFKKDEVKKELDGLLTAMDDAIFKNILQ